MMFKSLIVSLAVASKASFAFQPLAATRASSALASAAVEKSYSMDLKPEWTTPKQEGDAVPEMTFVTRVRIESEDENPFDWKDVPSKDIFAGKRVVVFSLPGAFTPTCSSTHVPGYDALYDEIKATGIDEIYCT